MCNTFYATRRMRRLWWRWCSPLLTHSASLQSSNPCSVTVRPGMASLCRVLMTFTARDKGLCAGSVGGAQLAGGRQAAARVAATTDCCRVALRSRCQGSTRASPQTALCSIVPTDCAQTQALNRKRYQEAEAMQKAAGVGERAQAYDALVSQANAVRGVRSFEHITAAQITDQSLGIAHKKWRQDERVRACSCASVLLLFFFFPSFFLHSGLYCTPLWCIYNVFFREFTHCQCTEERVGDDAGAA